MNAAGIRSRRHLDVRAGLMQRLNESDGRVVIDLRQAEFVSPSGLVTVACLARAARDRGMEIEFREPQVESDCSKYLYRMQLHERLADLGVVVGFTPVRSHDQGDNLLELAEFDATSRGSVDELAARVFRLTGAALGADAAQRLYTAVVEAAGNVVEHAGSACGYAALQAYPRPGRAMFAIGDAGRGLRSTLSAHLVVADDLEAVTMAVRPGLTGTGTPGRGKGLPIIQETCRTRFDLISGRGHLISGEEGLQLTRPGVPFPGTLVVGTVPV